MGSAAESDTAHVLLARAARPCLARGRAPLVANIDTIPLTTACMANKQRSEAALRQPSHRRGACCSLARSPSASPPASRRHPARCPLPAAACSSPPQSLRGRTSNDDRGSSSPCLLLGSMRATELRWLAMMPWPPRRPSRKARPASAPPRHDRRARLSRRPPTETAPPKRTEGPTTMTVRRQQHPRGAHGLLAREARPARPAPHPSPQPSLPSQGVSRRPASRRPRRRRPAARAARARAPSGARPSGRTSA